MKTFNDFPRLDYYDTLITTRNYYVSTMNCKEVDAIDEEIKFEFN